MESFNKKNLDQLDFLKKNYKNVDMGKNGFNKSINDLKKQNSNIESNQFVEKILIVDTETTGLDENSEEVIEIGCILFHVSSKSVLSQASFLLPVNENKAEYINGIPQEVSNISQPWEKGLDFFLSLVDSCDLIVAHNAEFDKKWFGKGKLPHLSKKWLCSLEDINWSFKKSLKSRPSVSDLALSFEIPVWNLHRALSDCYYLSEVFKKCENLEDLLMKAKEPRYLYKAIVSYEDRTLAKNAGFRWNSPIQGAWTRKLSENEAVKLDFEVQILEK